MARFEMLDLAPEDGDCDHCHLDSMVRLSYTLEKMDGRMSVASIVGCRACGHTVT